MNKNEAYYLLELIEKDKQTGPASVYQIGNFEYVVIIKARGYFLWELVDYRRYLTEREERMQASREAKKQELIAV